LKRCALHLGAKEVLDMRRLLVPLALVGLIFVWAGPTSAFSISFIETGDETAPIVVSTDIPGATQATAPETALVTKTFFSLVPELQTDGVFVFGLTEPGSRSTISDIVRITLTTTNLGGFIPTFAQSLVASFESDPETFLVNPGSFTDLIEETGSPQVVFDCLLAFIGDCLTVTAQSDFTPVPEPSMGILVGTMGLIGIGGALWRRSRRTRALAAAP
jgi:hypothetical protein